MYIVYGILLRTDRSQGAQASAQKKERSGKGTLSPVAGIGGEPVHGIYQGDIVGLVSRLNVSPAADVKNLMAYNRVIAAYHEHRTILPMRFGAFFQTRDQVRAALKKNEDLYTPLLRHLSGRTEMCIRLTAGPSPVASGEKVSPVFSAKRGRGAAFLRQRKAFYQQKEGGAPRMQKVAGMVIASFQELYVDVKQECKTLGAEEREGFFSSSHVKGRIHGAGGVASLFFLIAETAVAAFRLRFDEIMETLPVESSITGPWAPFNFTEPGSASVFSAAVDASEKRR